MNEYNAAPNQDPIEEMMKESKNEHKEMIKRDVDAISAGINPFGVNEDLRMTPTIDTTPHQEPKGILEKIGDGTVVRQKAFQTPPKAGRIIGSRI